MKRQEYLSNRQRADAPRTVLKRALPLGLAVLVLGGAAGCAPAAAPPPSKGGVTFSTLEDTWWALERFMEPCDQAAASAVEQFGGNGLARRTNAYMAAAIAADRCREASDRIGAIEPAGTLKGAESERFGEALKQCADGYGERALMLRTMSEIANGDERPSQVAAVGMFGQSSREKTIACLATMVEVAHAHGVTLSSR